MQITTSAPDRRRNRPDSQPIAVLRPRLPPGTPRGPAQPLQSKAALKGRTTGGQDQYTAISEIGSVMLQRGRAIIMYDCHTTKKKAGLLDNCLVPCDLHLQHHHIVCRIRSITMKWLFSKTREEKDGAGNAKHMNKFLPQILLPGPIIIVKLINTS